AEMDLFSLIRAPNPAKVKTGSRPRAPHKLPLLALTASRVIEMDEPAVASDSSGVPSAIEKSPLDFADEAEASGRETAAPEMPPHEEVPLATVSGSGQAVEDVVAGPPTVRESRIPDDVSDPDPLAFAGAPSSQGVTVAEDPGSKNASSPIEVEGVPVSIPAVVPQGLAVLLVDGATQTDPEENLFAFCAPWETFLLPNVLGLVLWARSPRPLGLQPAYAADHAPRLHFPARMSPHMGLPILGLACRQLLHDWRCCC
nr:hypothetical protein [Tanacetum cinerariifolium]